MGKEWIQIYQICNGICDGSSHGWNLFFQLLQNWRFKGRVSSDISSHVRTNPNIRVFSLKKCKLITIRFPFDWKTLVGYSVVIFEQISATMCHGYIGGFFIVSFIGFCKFCYTLTIDINDSLQVINDDVKTSNPKERMKWMNALTKIIQFHGDSQQLSFKVFLF